MKLNYLGAQYVYIFTDSTIIRVNKMTSHASHLVVVLQVSSKCLEERTLKLTVYNITKQRKQQVLGHVLYPLKHLLTDVDEKVTLWRDLEREPEVSYMYYTKLTTQPSNATVAFRLDFFCFYGA